MPTLSENKSSKNLEKEILSTLIFYKILNVPCLTAFEIYRRLITNEKNVSLTDIKNNLADSPSIRCKNGFYWTNVPEDNTPADCFDQRMRNAKTSAKKIKKAKSVSRLLSIIPFIKSIGISGSVSMNGARPESDIDFFIISSKDRIWLTRLSTVLLTQLIGQRRHRDIIEDKICLNIYIADEATKYPVKNMANSQMIVATLPLYNHDIFKRFFSANSSWMSNHINNFAKNIYLKNGVADNRMQKNNHLLDRLETLSAKIFSDRIFRKTPDAKPPHLVMDSTALLFHYPRSKNAEATEKYNHLTSRLTKSF